MKRSLEIIPFVLISLFIAAPCFSEYRITLKNGRDFVVENYQEVDGKIRFYRPEGMIEFDKNIIESIKKTKKAVETYESTPSPETKKETSEKSEPVKSDPSKKKAAEERMREVAKQKKTLMAEGEKLIAEKKKLQAEISKEGQVIYQREERDYKRRISELEEKISRYNVEVGKLDEEQEVLMKEIEGQK